MGWKNVMLSTHIYVNGAQEEAECLINFKASMQSVDEMQSQYRVPYYLGEFNVKPSPHMNDILRKFILKLQEKERSWSLWSYKVAGRCPRGKMWGLYLKSKNIKYIDPFLDNETTCLKKIDQLRTENFIKNDLLIRVCEETKF